jgi:hypothetical protein
MHVDGYNFGVKANADNAKSNGHVFLDSITFITSETMDATGRTEI